MCNGVNKVAVARVRRWDKPTANAGRSYVRDALLRSSTRFHKKGENIAADMQDPNLDDEQRLVQLEARLSKESGADSKNDETFGESALTGWTFEEALAANNKINSAKASVNLWDQAGIYDVATSGGESSENVSEAGDWEDSWEAWTRVQQTDFEYGELPHWYAKAPFLFEKSTRDVRMAQSLDVSCNFRRYHAPVLGFENTPLLASAPALRTAAHIAHIAPR